MIRPLLLAFAALIPVPAAAQSSTQPAVRAPAVAEGLEGSWALRLGGAIIFRFDIERDGAGWRGSWTRPRSFASDGDRFSNLTGATTIKSEKGSTIGEWAELTFADDRPGAVADVFRFHLQGADEAELIYVGTGLAPYTLQRVAADALLGPFEEGKVYRRPGMAAASPRRPAPAPERKVQGPPVEGR